MQEKRDDVFFCKTQNDLKFLDKWLQPREYNSGGEFKQDKKGNPMFQIGYDKYPEDKGNWPEKRGLIVVTDHSLCEQVDDLIVKNFKELKTY